MFKILFMYKSGQPYKIMSRNYKFHNPEGLYFVCFAVVSWLCLSEMNTKKSFWKNHIKGFGSEE